PDLLEFARRLHRLLAQQLEALVNVADGLLRQVRPDAEDVLDVRVLRLLAEIVGQSHEAAFRIAQVAEQGDEQFFCVLDRHGTSIPPWKILSAKSADVADLSNPHTVDGATGVPCCCGTPSARPGLAHEHLSPAWEA